jgi:hypothetical protein
MFSGLWVAGTSWREHEITGWCMADFKKNVVKFLRSAYRAWNEPPKTYDYENEKVLSGRLFPDQVRGALINAQDSKIEFFVRDNRILLKNLTDPEAIDELCAMAIDVKYPLAREIATECNYEPRGLHRRVLFFYATQQWAKYDALDPDGELLRRAYTLATPDERKQIAAAGRAGGRSEIVELVAKAWQAGAKPVPKADAEIAIETLLEQKRYAELWAFAREAAPKQSARALRLLAKTDWQPEEAADRIMYANLSKLSLKCPPDFTPVSTLKEIKKCSIAPNPYFFASWCTLQISRDCQYVVINNATTLYVVNIENQQVTNQKTVSEAEEYSQYFDKLKFSQDGNFVTYIEKRRSSKVARVVVVRFPSLEIVNEFRAIPSVSYEQVLTTFVGVDKIAICGKMPTPDNLGAKSTSGKERYQITIYHILTGEVVSEIEWNEQYATRVGASPDGQILEGYTTTGNLYFWNVTDGTFLYQEERNQSGSYALNDWNLLDGEKGLYAEFNTRFGSLDLRNVRELGNFPTIPYHNSTVANAHPYCGSLHPNQKFLAIGYNDQKVRIWNLERRRIVRVFKGFGQTVADVKFTPNNDKLIAVATDGILKVWGASRLQEICERSVAESSLHDLFWLQKRLKRCKTKDEYAWTRFAEALLQPKFRYEIEIGDWNVPTADRYDIDLE